MLTKTPNGLPEIIHTFGDPHDPQFEAKNIVLFDLPYPIRYAGVPKTRARCHKLLVDNFVAVFKDIQAAGLVDPWANDYSGIYAVRPIRGYPKFPSCHSWGIAIDLEAAENPLGSQGHMNAGVITIFKKHGFFWGGDFIHRHDPMHFQFALGY
jgi:hypothetical protein